jgi:hypothetical protein
MVQNYSWFQPLPRNFPVNRLRERTWHQRGWFYRSTPEFKLLKRIEVERDAVASGKVTSICWLLPYRAEIRKLVAGSYPSADVVDYYMASCPSEMIPICIWLIGKCAVRFRLYGIPFFCRDSSPQIRKHAAKALRRLEAWSLLDEMAALYPVDDRIQWFATAPVSHGTFTKRLSNYLRSVDDAHADEVATPSRMPYWAMEGSWEYTPPKSRDLIRRMLRRIRHWVRWGAT